jgi:predicted N-acetyltransferase YhbS
MPDMLVRLYDLPEFIDSGESLARDIKIKRAMAPDGARIREFISANFGDSWANEYQKALFNTPPSCFIAVKNKEVVGFACYDATALGYFGPVGVLESERGSGIGKALTLRCMTAMREAGYGYAIIGWVGPADFYKKVCGATVIEPSSPGVYKNMINVD